MNCFQIREFCLREYEGVGVFSRIRIGSVRAKYLWVSVLDKETMESISNQGRHVALFIWRSSDEWLV